MRHLHRLKSRLSLELRGDDSRLVGSRVRQGGFFYANILHGNLFSFLNCSDKVSLPARRIGQRWRATRAPPPVSIRTGRAAMSCSFLSPARSVLRKAINSLLPSG